MATPLDPTAAAADAGRSPTGTPPPFPAPATGTAAAPGVASAAEAAAAAEHAAASTRLTHSILSAAEAAVLLPSSSPGAATPAAAVAGGGGGAASSIRPAGPVPATAAAAIAPVPAGGRVGTMPRNATRRGIKYRCGTCGQRGHNAKTCTGTKDGAGGKVAGSVAAAGVETVVAGRVGPSGSPQGGVAGAPVEGATFLGDEPEDLVEAGSAVRELAVPAWQPVPSGVVVVGTPALAAAPSSAGSAGATAAAGGAGATPPAGSADDAGHPLFARALAVAKKRVVAAEATVFALRAAPLSDFSTAATQLASAVSALETVLTCARRCSTALGEEGSGGGLLTDGPPAKRACV